MPIRIRAIITIILTNLLIISFSVFAGIHFIGSNIQTSQETDLSVVADIADHFISGEIAQLRLKIATVAQDISNEAEEDWPEVLAYQKTHYPEFIEMTILDREMGLISASGDMPAPLEILDDPHIQRAFQGTISFSTTHPSSIGMLLYLAAPLTENRIVVLTLPGGYFSQRVSTFIIWQSGHIFMTDAQGIIIANIRDHWVQNRINFFELAETQPQFIPVAQVLSRIVAHETGVGYFPMDGVSRLCSFRPVSASQEGWAMGIIAPLPESPFRDIDRGLVVVGIVAFILSIIAAVIASAFIKRPFDRIEALKVEAEQNSMYKSTFLANMSHEMRTPMNAIIGMTTIGKGSRDIDKKDYAFEKIENASTHLLGVINDVLDMSKIEANKLELSYETFNFENLFQKVVNVINFRVEEKEQNFAVHIDKRIPPFLIGDDQRLAQVITNFLSNAVKFTPDKGNIRLAAQHLSEENGVHTIQVEVSDSGIGVSEEHQSLLFVPFQQAESGTSRKFGGTGLGLAISKRIVELMDGRIWINSELGKGATFGFTFQAKEGQGLKKSLIDINLNNIRILVVDDSSETLDYFKEILLRYNLTCDTVVSGEEALEAIRLNGLYDMYFVDWKMSGMDGIELCQKITEMNSGESAKESVMIMISAGNWDSFEEQARNAGISKFLSKPLFPSSIVDIINECLGSHSIQQSEDPLNEIESFEQFSMLLVEDVDINREIVMTLLQPTGINIDCAENGKVAVDKFCENPDKYDLIFMDIQMPTMDGYEATRRIRAIEAESKPAVPIIAMTANVFREDVEKCLASGMNDHLGKPLDIEAVIEKLRKYLHQ